MARTGARHDWLWVTDRGRSYTSCALSHRIGNVTEALTGVRVPPHFFRDALATTLARASPEAARLIRAILGHADYRTAERHYVHAQGIDDRRSLTALIGRLKETPAGRRSGRFTGSTVR